jgi:hypothetical protein
MGQAQLPMVIDPLFNSENFYNYDEFMAANQQWMKGPKSFNLKKKKKERKRKPKNEAYPEVRNPIRGRNPQI